MPDRERFHEDFVQDLIAISDYYDSVSPATGSRFRETLEKWLDLIVDIPESFAPVYESVRAVRIRNYPYVILYESFPEYVYFIGIVHGASDREHWFTRLS